MTAAKSDDKDERAAFAAWYATTDLAWPESVRQFAYDAWRARASAVPECGTREMCGRIGPACDTPGCSYTNSGHCKLEQRAVSTSGKLPEPNGAVCNDCHVLQMPTKRCGYCGGDTTPLTFQAQDAPDGFAVSALSARQERKDG